jgi:serralysin
MGRVGGDRLDGGDGLDTVSYRMADEGVTATLILNMGVTGEAKGDRYRSIEHLEGSEHNDLLTGKLFGDSNVSGLGGNDGIYGGRGDNALDGGDGNDIIYADAGDDTVDGGAGDDKLFAGDGDDVVNGGAGDDVLDGGRGKDVFAFTEAGGADAIRDFNRGHDKIDLSAIDAVAGGGDDAFSFIGKAAFSHTAGELRVYREGRDHFLAGDLDGDGLADFTIETNIPIITADLVL